MGVWRPVSRSVGYVYFPPRAPQSLGWAGEASLFPRSVPPSLLVEECRVGAPVPPALEK